MSVTPETLNKINSLKSGIESVTGESYSDLTSAVQGLKNGYGQGGGEENQLHAILDGTLTNIDSNVTKVKAYACREIYSLKTVSLPNCISIGGYAFMGCTNLETITAPKVSTLAHYSFYGCSNLKEVNFQHIKQVPSTCFYQCTKLQKADFGVKCNTLIGHCLAYCKSLETLILRCTDGVVSIATNTFEASNFDGYVYVPAALLADYEVNENWATYGDSPTFRAIEDYPEICG
jgi:hypothetical protein